MSAINSATCMLLAVSTIMLGLTNMRQTDRIEALEAQVQQLIP